MAVSVTGPRAVNELGGPVIPGNFFYVLIIITRYYHFSQTSHSGKNLFNPLTAGASYIRVFIFY